MLNVSVIKHLKFVSCTDWGTDQSDIKLFDTVYYQGVRLSLGAFRTSPVESFQVEAN
jgi:hypothetical protein